MTRAEFVRRWSRGEAAMADDLTALLDAERASAREEQRKADALAIYGPAVAEVAARVEALEAFGAKVNAIRDSIVGAQALNWSEHAYPLVAALDAAGFSGKPYPEARANVGTLLERLATAERERDEARAAAKESAASDMDSLQRLRAVDPALERARVERDDAERARDEWKARAEKAEAERNEARTLAKTAGEALLAAGLMVLPERCSPRCSSNAAQYDEDNRCDCGREEGEHRNKVCEDALSALRAAGVLP